METDATTIAARMGEYTNITMPISSEKIPLSTDWTSAPVTVAWIALKL